MAEIYAIHYPDRDAAKLVYRQIGRMEDELGIIAHGLETYKVHSKRARNRLKIIIALDESKSQDLPSMLKLVENNLKEHPLYSYLSFDNTAYPLSQIKWNFDSYDDSKYQKIFMQKRERG